MSIAALGRVPTDPLAAYRQSGFLVGDEPFPLVGMAHPMAGAFPESAFVLVTFSMPSRALTFSRDGEQYHATYSVAIEFVRDSTVTLNATSQERVRVASFRETSRGEESVIFQRFFVIAPGRYTLSLRARDSVSGRVAQTRARVDVPVYDTRGALTAIPVYHAESRTRRGEMPSIIPNPRNTAVFGRDNDLALYVEWYGLQDSVRVPLRILDLYQRTLIADTVRAVRKGDVVSAVVRLPVAVLGLGVVSAELTSPTQGVTRLPLVVSLGDGVAVTTFGEMLEYLRFYTTVERLRTLRDTSTDARPEAWVRFLRETDPVPTTIEHEGLRDYFQRLAEANARFRDEGTPGWLTERGMVFATLGEPDQILERATAPSAERGRVQVWEYARYRTQIMFVDATGFGSWRLAPGSEAEFTAIARRVKAQ